VEAAEVVPGAAAARGAALKREKYEARCAREGYLFEPFVFETIGGFDPACDVVLKRIGQNLADVDNMSVERAIRRLRARVNFVWQRCLGRALVEQRHHFSNSLPV
jgi:hypothetical protein